MIDAFDGEYWNTDKNSSGITRICFVRRTGGHYASAWGSCFPRDCEWGETRLHLLNDHDARDACYHAFATWHGDSEPSHCLMTLAEGLLTVTLVAIRSEFASYQMTATFRKDAERSAEAQNLDPLAKFKQMWDGSEPGWKLIQYDTQVFFVELTFDDDGPNESEIPAIVEFVERLRDQSEDKVRELLRGCTGIGLGGPLGRAGLDRLYSRQAESDLRVTVYTVGVGEYLVLSPDGGHYGWMAFPSYRRPVVERMLAAGVPVVSGHLE